MSLEYVLQVFNEEQMGNWCERIYNKDSEYKYILPLTEGVTTGSGTSYYNYLYALQGSRYAHRTYTIQNRFALLDSQYVAGTYRRDSFAAYFGYKFGSDNRKFGLRPPNGIITGTVTRPEHRTKARYLQKRPGLWWN